MASQDIIRISGTTDITPASQARIGAVQQVTKLFDATKCTGCKACQVACSEWNDLREDVGTFQGSYQNPMTLSPESWNIMQYHEVMDNNKLRWQFTHTACMHCADPACLKACSTSAVPVLSMCLRSAPKITKPISAPCAPIGSPLASSLPALKPAPWEHCALVPAKTCCSMPKNASSS